MMQELKLLQGAATQYACRISPSFDHTRHSQYACTMSGLQDASTSEHTTQRFTSCHEPWNLKKPVSPACEYVEGTMQDVQPSRDKDFQAAINR